MKFSEIPEGHELHIGSQETRQIDAVTPETLATLAERFPDTSIHDALYNAEIDGADSACLRRKDDGKIVETFGYFDT